MAGRKGKSTSASQKSYSASYVSSNREAKNRERNLKRHLKKHPNDKQAEAAVSKKPVHRKKPSSIKKIKVNTFGTQQISEGVFSYVSDRQYKFGHPVLAMSKTAYPFEQARKIRNCGKFSEDFKVVYARYVN